MLLTFFQWRQRLKLNVCSIGGVNGNNEWNLCVCVWMYTLWMRRTRTQRRFLARSSSIVCVEGSLLATVMHISVHCCVQGRYWRGSVAAGRSGRDHLPSTICSREQALTKRLCSYIIIMTHYTLSLFVCIIHPIRLMVIRNSMRIFLLTWSKHCIHVVYTLFLDSLGSLWFAVVAMNEANVFTLT